MSVATTARLSLPWPPTVNTYWRRAGARLHISHKGHRYRTAVAEACLEQKAPRLGTARIRMAMTVHPPDQRRRDLDNLTKAVLDALEQAHVFIDDGQIDELTVRRAEPRPGGLLTVLLEPIL